MDNDNKEPVVDEPVVETNSTEDNKMGGIGFQREKENETEPGTEPGEGDDNNSETESSDDG